MKNFKKAIVALVTLSSLLPLQSLTLAENDFISYSSEYKQENVASYQIQEIPERHTGFIPEPEPLTDFEHTPEYIYGEGVEPFSFGFYNTLPESYDATEDGFVTSVKNQKDTGTCWAFSTISAIETNMIKKGYANTSIDYSERHLAYFTHTKNQVLNDGFVRHDKDYGYYGGDNQVNAGQILVGWQGAELESNFPFLQNCAEMNKDANLPDQSARYNSFMHLQGYIEPKNQAEAKQAILDYGSVVAGYYDSNTYLSTTNGNYAYYQNSVNNAGANHAITIVGWDDNYPVTNFTQEQKPQNPGAWKVKNSWGEGWGEDGYFWISYEDTSLGDYVAFDAEKSDNYQIIHQYDGARWGVSSTTDKSANIFTADKNQLLKAAGFYTPTASSTNPVNYTVEIYKLNQNPQNPEDGVKVSTASDTVLQKGYYTAALDNTVPLNEGDKFSVVLTLKYPSNSNAGHAFESDTLGTTSVRGQSYIYNGTWHDASMSVASINGVDHLLNNACIKAYSTTSKVNVNYNTNDGNEIASTEAFQYTYLTPPENPKKAGKYFAGWFKDSALTDEWDFENDIIEADTTLYAKWSNTPISVKSITLSYSGSEISVEEYVEIKAKVVPYYATHKITWSSSTDACHVARGTVIGVRAGSSVITASAGGKTATAAITVNGLEVIAKSNKPVYAEGETIGYMVSCDISETCIPYLTVPDGTTYFIKKNSGEYIDTNNLFTIGYPYTPGKYTIYAEITDASGNVKTSPAKSFWVTNSPTLVADQTPEGYSIGGYNSDAGSIMVAYYDDNNRLVKTDIIQSSDSLHTLPYDYQNAFVKFMWWNGTDDIKPITTAIETDHYINNTFIAN